MSASTFEQTFYLERVEGDTAPDVFVIKTKVGETVSPLDLDSEDCSLTFRVITYNEGTTILTKNSSNGGITFITPTGYSVACGAQINYEAADVASWSEGSYQFQLQMTRASGTKSTPARGEYMIQPKYVT